MISNNTMSVAYDFSNKVVLVTGGTGALGRALVNKFINSSAITISSYRDDKEAENLKSENVKVELIKMDIK
ncbi:MAG: KR domain-containing protein [Thaumarchaeota archaeon]|nr:MAG: KR domain-containing protein [Nitrososphaerota archaeon]